MVPSIPDHPADVVVGSWPATARYDLDAAPGGLGLVQDLLNTISAGAPGNRTSWTIWAAPRSGRGWPWRSGRRPPGGRHPPSRSIRRGSGSCGPSARSCWTGSTAGCAARRTSGNPPRRRTGFRPGSRTTEATLRLDRDGSVHLDPAGVGADLLISLVLAALFEAQLADVGRRIKTCRNPRCRVAFYDRSRNNSGVWRSVRTCGHPTNLRAHRARQRQVD